MTGRFANYNSLASALNKIVPRLLSPIDPCPTILLNPSDFRLVAPFMDARFIQHYLSALNVYVFFEVANSVGVHSAGTILCGVSAGDSYGFAVRYVTDSEESEGLLPESEIKGNSCGLRQFQTWWSSRKDNIHLIEQPGYHVADFRNSSALTGDQSKYEFYNRWF